MKFWVWAWRNLDTFLAGISMAVIVLFVFTNVLLRYLFNTSIEWFNEVSTILFVWTTMFGAGAAARHKLHPAIDIISNLFRGKMAKWVRFIVNLIVLCLLAEFTVLSWNFAWKLGMQKFTAMMEIPYTYVYLALPLGFGIMFIRVFFHFLADLNLLGRNKEVLSGSEPNDTELGGVM
jgi:TRAP-type C4-dicarboxylate transport system permease small subunit